MIRRAPRKQSFTVLPNAALDDSSLSFRARGVLAYILSKPDDWKASSHHLASQGREGRDAVRKALNELEDAGYAQLVKTRDDSGTYSNEWWVSDSRDWKSATGDGLSGPGKPGAGFSGPLVSTEEQVLNRKAGAAAENRVSTEDQLAHLRALKDELRHPREEGDGTGHGTSGGVEVNEQTGEYPGT